MATNEPGSAPQLAALTSLPRLEDIPQAAGGGYEPDRVREAFEAFRRHALQLQAQLRVLQAVGSTANVEPSGHAVRMDALHLIRAAAEFADAVERDAQNAASTQISKTENEVRKRQHELAGREVEVDRYREETERQRNEIMNGARNEARELLATANRDATAELREAEARAARLLEQARHQATELTNAARAEIEQTLEWARAQATTIINRAQQGAEQLLTAAGLGPDALVTISAAILESARGTERPPAPSTPSSSVSAFESMDPPAQTPLDDDTA
jgi:vacuolar-type H+-ATPase subunit H